MNLTSFNMSMIPAAPAPWLSEEVIQASLDIIKNEIAPMADRGFMGINAAADAMVALVKEWPTNATGQVDVDLTEEMWSKQYEKMQAAIEAAFRKQWPDATPDNLDESDIKKKSTLGNDGPRGASKMPCAGCRLWDSRVLGKKNTRRGRGGLLWGRRT